MAIPGGDAVNGVNAREESPVPRSRSRSPSRAVEQAPDEAQAASNDPSLVGEPVVGDVSEGSSKHVAFPSVPVQPDGCATLDEDKVLEIERKLETALIGRMFGKRIPFSVLQSELGKRWTSFGKFELSMLSSDTFICIFSSSIIRDKVARAGGWSLFGALIGVDKWSRQFRIGDDHPFLSNVWVRLPHLPLSCWNCHNLARIATSIGEPVCIDRFTADMKRMEYARFCVRMDLSKKLKASTRINSSDGPFLQPIQYEGIQLLCFQCGRVGHKMSDCKRESVAAPQVGVAVGTSYAAAVLGNTPAPQAIPTVAAGAPDAQSSVKLQVDKGKRIAAESAAPDRGLGEWTLVVPRRTRQLTRRPGSNRGRSDLPLPGEMRRRTAPYVRPPISSSEGVPSEPSLPITISSSDGSVPQSGDGTGDTSPSS